MKSVTKQTIARNVLSDSSTDMEHLLSLSSAFTKGESTIQGMHLKSLKGELFASKKVSQRQLLSRSMEKTFVRFRKSHTARDAYVQAEVSTFLAHQIRAIRQQRGWTQMDLARRLGTTQAAVSRIEDPSYGRLSLKTLTEISRVFDVGLQVRFVSTITMLVNTFKPKAADRLVPSFEEEKHEVSFYDDAATLQVQQSIPPARTVTRINSAMPTARYANTLINPQVMHSVFTSSQIAEAQS